MRATETDIVHDATGTAAVVWLRNSGAAQAGVPVAIRLTDRNGKAVYANDLAGLDVSLTSIASVPARAKSFWVNDQVQAPTTPERVVAKVGTAKRPSVGALPKLEITKLELDRDTDGAYALGVIVNHSKTDQQRLVISCLSRRGSKVVAAGRSIVERLVPAPTPKPVTFRVYFIGNPSGGRLLCSAPPTVVPGGSS